MDGAHGRSGWLRGVLDLCALAVLASGERHGYGLAAELELAGVGAVKGGTLYPMLARLEAEGSVSFRWEPGEGGPARKYYAITDSGRARLADRGGSWARFARDVCALLESRAEGDRDGTDPAGVPGPPGAEHAREGLPRAEDP